MSLELRARAAAATIELLFAFNPHQRRDSRGRWTRMPDSELKRPRRARRTAPAAEDAPSGPRQLADVLDSLKDGPRFLEPDELDPAVKKWAEDLFAFEDPQTGYTSRVTRVRGKGGPEHQDLDMVVEITDPEGRKVGNASRRVRRDKNGKLQVDHISFHLDKSKQGGGFSSRWLAQMEDRYRDAGIEQIWLVTDLVGSYAWAKAGFDFADRDEAKLVASKLAAALRKKENQRDLPQRVITDGNELVRRTRAADAEIPTPAEFAMLGWTPGAETWLGKETLLNRQKGKIKGISWEGIKSL